MNKALYVIPDISGFTEFINSTEIEHSQHIIAELLEILIDSNVMGLTLAEIEGDALFFYKEANEFGSIEIFDQLSRLFTAFYRHLHILKENRICPCHACATAPNLELKVVIHYGDIGFIQVKDHRKPFGRDVIVAHRLLKNKIPSNNYILFSSEIWNAWNEPPPPPFRDIAFIEEHDLYDGKEVIYYYGALNPELFPKKDESIGEVFTSNRDPDFKVEILIENDIEKVYEFLSNYRYRSYWQDGVDSFEYNPEEVTRLGTAHVCVIDQTKLRFEVVIKKVLDHQKSYGEKTWDIPLTDAVYNFYVLEKTEDNKTVLLLEAYFVSKGPIQRFIAKILFKKKLENSSRKNLTNFKHFAEKQKS